MSSISTLGLSRFLPDFLVKNPVYQNQIARTLLFSLGAAYMATKLAKYAAHLLVPIFYTSRNLANKYGKGSWVFITGASDGIGEAFSLEFASKGFNLVLLGRNEEKLRDTERKCKEKYPLVQTRILVFDLEEAYKEGFVEKIYEEVGDLDISILVNNAGQMLKGLYMEQELKDIRSLVMVNCVGFALVLRVLLPKLNSRVKKSAIINMSSKVATFPRPYQQIYGASKSFDLYLSSGLAYEYSKNIDMIALQPGKIMTEMTDYHKPDMKTITPTEFVKVALTYVGKAGKTYGHVKHRWASWTTDVIPGVLKKYYFWSRYPDLEAKEKAAKRQNK